MGVFPLALIVVLTRPAPRQRLLWIFVVKCSLIHTDHWSHWSQDRDAREIDVPTLCFALGPHAGAVSVS